ncbi:hypothetical protein L228DRAFT_260985 [Xylona heveae TC161]|uniref:Uncharacterized protein n=1 Tax=Xylona heveae (strain CBS 132557 / TC161) TaxID=1328760 RepID=A0A165H158_XYLHT|nr:hypothetical protein L228DRAFT_260985 [Xylona heveae TC161]KZF22855.1 hypothetical protein L228DRAFT_260985 [Xylona heveae TC161]
MSGFRSMIEDFGLEACPPISKGRCGFKPAPIGSMGSPSFTIYEDSSDESIYQVPSIYSDSDSENCPPTPCPKSKRVSAPGFLDDFVKNGFKVNEDRPMTPIPVPAEVNKTSIEKVEQYLASMNAADHFTSDLDFFDFHDTGVLMRNIGTPNSDLMDFTSPLEVNTVYIDNATRGQWKSPIWYSGSAFYGSDEFGPTNTYDPVYEEFAAMSVGNGHVPRRPFGNSNTFAEKARLAHLAAQNNSAGHSIGIPGCTVVSAPLLSSGCEACDNGQRAALGLAPQVDDTSAPSSDFPQISGFPSLPTPPTHGGWTTLEEETSQLTKPKHSRFFSSDTDTSSILATSDPADFRSPPIANFPFAGFSVNWEPSPAEVLQVKMQEHNIRAEDEVRDEIYSYEWDEDREMLVGPILVRSQAPASI